MIKCIGKILEIILGITALCALIGGSLDSAGVYLILMMQIMFWRERSEYVKKAIVCIHSFLCKSLKKILVCFAHHLKY
jgi:hypothetical protein